MHNKIHSVIFLLPLIKNADKENGWNARIQKPVWIISTETGYLLLEQKKFQNKSKNIDEVYQSVFFRCIMFLKRPMIWDIPFKILVNQRAWSNRQWIPD